MTELSDIDASEFIEKIDKVTSRFGGLDSAIDSLKARLISGDRTYKDSNEAYKRLMRERSKEEREIIAAQRRGNLTYKETQMALDKLNDKVRTAVPPEFKKVFENTVLNQNKLNNTQIFGNSLLVKWNKEIEIGTQVLSSLGSAVAKIFNAYRGGQTDIEMAGSTFQAAAGALLGTTGAAGKGLSALGTAMMGTAPLLAETGPFALGVAGVGLGLTFLGGIIDQGSEQLNKLAQQAIPILTQEVNKLYTSFNAISSTGAVFAGGIKEMNASALAVRLTLPEFADVIKENSGNLAQLGISTTEAAKRMGNVGLELRRSGADRQLAALGYTAKEQASLIADTMALMRQSGGSLTVSNEQVAQQTQKYAENLRIISAITGEDAKKKEQQVRDQANEVAFQQKLAGMDATQRQNVIAAMENMSDAQRKAFMEVTVFGQAITPASAYMMSNLQGFGDSVNRAAAEFSAGTLDGASMRRTNAEFGAAMKADILASVDLARAGMAGVPGLVSDLNKALKDELLERNRVTAESIAAAEAAVKLQTTATETTTKSLIDAAYAGRDMANEIQQAVLDTNVLSIFAGTIADTTEAITNVIREFTQNSPYATSVRGGLSNREVQDEVGRLQNRLNSMQETRYNINSQGQFINTGTRVVRPSGVTFDQQSGTFTGSGATPQSQAGNESRTWYEKLFGMAEGGIASGPKTGYLATLHGTEAVLPENLTNMLLESAKSNEVLRNQLPEAINRPDKSEELLSMLNSKFDDMISILDDISGHTERTSVRVA